MNHLRAGLCSALLNLGYIASSQAQILPGQQVPSGTSFAPAPASSLFSRPTSPFASMNAPPQAAQTTMFGNAAPPVGNAATPAPLATPAGSADDSASRNPRSQQGSTGTDKPSSSATPATSTDKAASQARVPPVEAVQAADLEVGTRLVGYARAVSGNTVLVDGHKLTLTGVISPDPDQSCFQGPTSWRCGEAARQAMDNLTSRGKFICTVGSSDAAGSSGTCKLGLDDVALAMVETGMVKSGMEQYRQALERARADRRGLWVVPSR